MNDQTTSMIDSLTAQETATGMSCGDRWSCGRPRIAGRPCLSQSHHINANKMLKPDKWNSAFSSDGKIFRFHKTLKRIILGGVDPSIRPQVWEFLLGCYAVATTSDYRSRLRTARRERYEELIKQCQMMHSSIGTGSLAYVVGAKVMDMRAPPKENGIMEPNVASEQASAESTDNVDEENCYKNIGPSLEFHSESSSVSGTLVSVRECAEGAAYDSSSFAAPSSNSKTLNGGREADESQYVNESCFDFPALPVTDLFGKGEEEQRDDETHNGKISRHKLRFKDERMHNFQISNNDELIIESNLSRFSASNNVLNPEIEVDRGDACDPVHHSNNIEKRKEIVNRMRISDVPDTEFIDGILPQQEPVSTDKVSEWLWTLHQIVVDVVRTDSHLEFYEDTRNLARMSDILAVYAWVDPATGYCQGMSDLLSPFIVLFEDDADAFWCFEMLLRRTRENFQMEGPTGVMKQLQQLSSIMELTDKEMFAHLSNIGAESLHFAFRMLLVLFRRELPFHEALSMWEMMWAADFDESMINYLEKNCLEALNVRIKRDAETEMRDVSVENKKDGEFSMSKNETGMKSATTQFCGWTTNFWSREDLTGICTSVSSSNKVDDELPVFCVAAILIINRQKIIRETRSIDDMIKIFNDKMLRINANRCVRTAIKIRKKYFYKVFKRKDSMAGNGE